LQLARSLARRQEFTIRQALGAGRPALIRMQLIESLTVALMGGLLGVLIAQLGIQLATALKGGEIPRLQEVGIDLRILLMTVVVSVAAGLLSGLLAAWNASCAGLNPSMARGGRGLTGSRSRLDRALVMAEVGLSVVLLVGAGLLLSSYWKLWNVDPGLRSEGLLLLRVTLPPAGYEGRPERRQAFFESLSQSIGRLPAVESVGMTSRLPMGASPGWYRNGFRRAEDPPGTRTSAYMRWVQPGFFETLGIPLLRGRLLRSSDDASSSKAVVIDQAMAERFWPGEDPLGRRILTYGQWEGEVVGIVGNVRQAFLREEHQPHYYVTCRQTPSGAPWSLEVALHTSLEPLSLLQPVRQAVAALDAQVPAYDFRSMPQQLADSLTEERFSLTLHGIFAGLALLLAVLGMYGVLSFSVSRRRREIGLRMALGAQRRRVVSQIVAEGLSPALAGLVLGLAGAMLLTRHLSALLFGVQPTDPATLAAVSSVLLLSALLACTLPARRASATDPAEALRCE
ncbi:MAG: FtsX-like permease family protein, partial [Acidobacteriota bacterium]